MTHVAPPSGEPCVWMTAGLVSYKLCDRDFDCDHCPLDLALRGGPVHGGTPALTGPMRRGEGFPDDRLYTAGHTWVERGPRAARSALRIGLDGFAAALLPGPVAVACAGGQRQLQRGDAVCDIELAAGCLSLGAPVAGRLEGGNPTLRERPGLVVESPYRDGWIAEVVPDASDAVLDGLLTAEEARERTALDLRRFRRRIALHLLAETAALGPSMADGGEALTSLHDILGGSRYLETLRDLIR